MLLGSSYWWALLIIMPQLGLEVGGNFNIHIWACSGETGEQVM